MVSTRRDGGGVTRHDGGGFVSTVLATTALGELAPVDVDRDGDLDLVTAEAGIDRVIENR